MKKLDQIFCALLALGALGHFFGTLKFYSPGTDTFVWSLSGAFACALLVAVNWLRNQRSQDRALRWVALVGNLAWLVIVVLFAGTLPSAADPRVLFHGVSVAGLLFFSLPLERRKS